jgi:hypothetical protein
MHWISDRHQAQCAPAVALLQYAGSQPWGCLGVRAPIIISRGAGGAEGGALQRMPRQGTSCNAHGLCCRGARGKARIRAFQRSVPGEARAQRSCVCPSSIQAQRRAAASAQSPLPPPPCRATCAQERPCAHAHLPHHVAEPRRVLPVAPDRLLQRPPRPFEPRHRPPPPSIQPIRAHPARGLRPILSHLCPPQCKAAVDVRRGEQAPAHAGPAPHLGRKERLRCPGL